MAAPEAHPLDRAIFELRKELLRAPEDAALLARLGSLLYRKGRLSEAEGLYRRALALAPRRAALHNNLGNVLCDQGRMKEGIGCYKEALALEEAASPAGPSAESLANLELARLEYRLIQERIEYYEQTVRLQVDSAEALNALGCAYLLGKRRNRALDSFRQAGRIDQRNRYAALNLAFVYSLDLGLSQDLPEALAECAECAMRFAGEPRLFIHQGEMLELAGSWEEAEEKYRRALKADAACLEAYELLGRLRELRGGRGTKDETARTVAAALARLEEEPEEGAGLASRARKLAHRAAAALARARFERRVLEAYAEPDQWLREALRLAESAGAWELAVEAGVLRSQILDQAGRRNEARCVLEQLAEKQPRTAKLWFELGVLALRGGEVAQAVELFERATLCDPQEASAYQSLRYAFEGYRRYRAERVRYEAAVRRDPRDPLAHQHLALAAYAVMKDEEALCHFTQAFNLDPRLAEAVCGRARVLRRQGHLAEAEEAWRQALRVDPDCQEAARALRALRPEPGIQGLAQE